MCTPLYHRQTKVQWAQVVFNGSKTELSGPTNPPPSVSRRFQNASLESPVMILPGVSEAEMTKKGKTTATNGVGQAGCSVRKLILSLVTKFCGRLIHCPTDNEGC